MITSMTGFGRAHEIKNGREILVEIKSVNSRYFEINTKIPRSCSFMEERIKSQLKEKISRGKVEISVSLTSVQGKETVVTINENVVESYLAALRQAGEKFGLTDDVKISSIFEMNDAFNVMKADVDEEKLWEDVKEVVSEALEKFVAMRAVEGEKLKQDALEKLLAIEKMLTEIEVYSPQNVENYRKKLFERLSEILSSTQIDEARILTEAAIFAEKTAVDEETVRLRSHIEQFRTMLKNESLVGRKLDFLVQEINRETNTIGSKAQDLRITQNVVNMKSEIEKIREQIQNIE